MMGVPIMEPKTPPFEMVNVPPSMSSIASSFFLAWKNGNPKGNVLISSLRYLLLRTLLFNIAIEDKIH